MSNPVEPDTQFPRLGNLYELARPDLPEVPALLHVDQERGLHLEVPFPAASHEGSGRWFARNGMECPETLLYQDHEMDLHLFGTYISSQGKDAEYQVGLGRLRADFAVEDRDRSDVEYSEVAATQSEIHGLHEFMAWRLAEFDFGDPEPGAALLRVAPRTKIVVDEFDGFEVSLTAATWAGRDRPNVHAVGETTLLRTRAQEPRPLDDHLRIHEAVRDLLAVVCWKPLDFSEVKVQREDAPARALAGNALGAAWRRLHNPTIRRATANQPYIELRFGDFLEPANFDSLGAEGLRTWLRRREEFSRFTDPLLAFRFLPVITPEVALMQASIAAEALGYIQAIRAGVPEQKAAYEPLPSRLARVVSGQPLHVESIAFDAQHWLDAAVAAYHGVKHANKVLPSAPLPTLIALTMTTMLRSQLLLELGVDNPPGWSRCIS